MPLRDRAEFEAFALRCRNPTDVDGVRRNFNLDSASGWDEESWPTTWSEGTSVTLTRARDAAEIEVADAWEIAHRVSADARVEDIEPLFVTGFVQEDPEGVRRGSGGFCHEAPDLPLTAETNWHLHLVNWYAAVDQYFKNDPAFAGGGIVIAQPDTGYTAHVQLGDHVDAQRACTVLREAGQPGVDPLHTGKMKNPGHGTGTASVVISPHGQAAGMPDVLGIAPGATLIPIRVTDSVVLLGMQALADGIRRATDLKAQVITMSLGGLDSDRLRDAVRYALQSGVIVLAAAGNCVRVVVYPAAIPGVVGVAGCNADKRPWRNSSRGRDVSITGPAESVWRARPALDGKPQAVERGYGTSFAVATTAGAAALWLSKHGDAITKEYGKTPALIPAAFRWCVTQSAAPSNLGGGFGAGILDIAKLLATGLPNASALNRIGSRGVTRGATEEFELMPGPMSPSYELGRLATGGIPRTRITRTIMPSLISIDGSSPKLRRSLEREALFHAAVRPSVYDEIRKVGRAPASRRGTLAADGLVSVIATSRTAISSEASESLRAYLIKDLPAAPSA